MTITDFYNLAVSAAKERGYENPDVTVHALYSKHGLYFTSKLWDKNNNRSIESNLQHNPEAALQALKDAIDFHNKYYDKNTGDLEL